jgi:hypothetical protein
MNTDYFDLLGFLGYGDPRKTIWFVGHEEHEPIENEDDADWDLWFNEKCGESAMDSISLKEVTVPIRWKPWPKESAKYNGYELCARLVEKLYGLERSEETWKRAFLVNVLILPHINESKGEDWTPWLRSKIGADSWNRRDYNREVNNARSVILADEAVKLAPKAIILLGNHAHKLNDSAAFKQTISKSTPTIPVLKARHPGTQGLNSHIKITEEEWMNLLIGKIGK